jgi:hypothetical protein
MKKDKQGEFIIQPKTKHKTSLVFMKSQNKQTQRSKIIHLTPDSFNSYNCSETLMNWQTHVSNIFGIGCNVTFIRFFLYIYEF